MKREGGVKLNDICTMYIHVHVCEVSSLFHVMFTSLHSSSQVRFQMVLRASLLHQGVGLRAVWWVCLWEGQPSGSTHEGEV